MKYRSIEEFVAKLHPNEPWFIIRAQDKFAAAAVQAYASLSKQHHSLHNIIELITAWQQANPDKVKNPD